MTAARRPWYREPMVWLVIALPASSVIAGTSLLSFAIWAGGADPVPDEVRRMSRIQLDDMSADYHAQTRGMHASVMIDQDTGALQVSVAGLEAGTGDEQPLALMFVHPMKSADDRTLPMVRAGDVWLGRFDGALDHGWQLRLTPGNRQWRLEGRIGAHQSAATLRPRSASG
jgi:uncharacterized protein